MSFNSRKAVADWNTKCALSPAPIYTPAYWQALGNQGERLIEEVQELVNAVQGRDRKELVDALADIQVVLDGAIFLAQHDHDGAMQAVCDNNDLKYTLSRAEAEKCAGEIENAKKESVNVQSANFEGQTYYSVHRDSDNKIMKPVGHPDVELSKFLPGAETLELFVFSKPNCPICAGLIFNLSKVLNIKTLTILDPYNSQADNDFCIENGLTVGDVAFYNGETLQRTNYGTQHFDIRRVERWLKQVGAL